MKRRLERLERDAARGGGIEVHARLLRGRVAKGLMPHDGLEIAARCGHEAAAAVLGDRGRELLASSKDPLPDWLRGLSSAFKGKLAARVVVYACVATLDRFYDYGHWLRCDRESGGACPCGGVDAPLALIACAQAWIMCPCRWHELACSAAGGRAGGGIAWWHWGPMAVAHQSGRGDRTQMSGARCAEGCLRALEAARIRATPEWLQREIAERLVGYALGDDLPLPELRISKTWPPKTDF